MRSMVEGAAIRAMHASGPTIVQDQKIASYDSDPKLFKLLRVARDKNIFVASRARIAISGSSTA